MNAAGNLSKMLQVIDILARYGALFLAAREEARVREGDTTHKPIEQTTQLLSENTENSNIQGENEMTTDYNASDIYKSRWLKAEHLDGDSQVVTIEDVTGEPVGELKEMKLILKFRGIEQVLCLNVTNAKVLQQLFGDIPNGWIGKKITLFIQDVSFAGKTMPAIRISPRLPKAAEAQQQPAQRTEEQINAELGYSAEY